MPQAIRVPPKVGALDVETGAVLLFGYPQNVPTAEPEGLWVFPRATLPPVPRQKRTVRKNAMPACGRIG